MKKRSAFTLLELTLYIGLTSFFIPLLFGFLSRSLQVLKKSIFLKEQSIKNIVVLSAMRKDLVSASMYAHEWDRTSFIFKKYYFTQHAIMESWIGWEPSEEGLRRIQGIWNPKTNRWTQKNVTIFHCNITAITIKKHITMDTLIDGISIACAIKQQQEPLEWYVRIRNRALSV